MAEFWPDSLVAALARREFVLFVGSGVSHASENRAGTSPPTWNEMIHACSDILPTNAAKNRVRKRLKGDVLDAAELLMYEAGRSGRRTDVLERIAELVDGPTGDRFPANAWHDELMRLDPGIVLTTNYDKILERMTDMGFAILRPDDAGIAREIRLGNPVVIKFHGHVDDRQSMVLSHSDYAWIRADCVHAIEVVRSLLLTRICLFVGYSLSDPDIRLLLENAGGGRLGEAAHYLLGPKPASPHLEQLFRGTYGVQLLSYGASHADGLERLKELGDLVEYARVGAPII